MSAYSIVFTTTESRGAILLQYDYQSITEVLSRLGPGNDAAESHGVLCGLLCTNDKDAVDLWLKHLLYQVNEGAKLSHAELATLLVPVISETRRQLVSVECDFQPILPDDSSGLGQQTIALAHWAQGFLVGVSFGGVKDLKVLPADSMEILMDFTKIARAASYQVDSSEDDAVAFTEIAEYVRAGVLLVYQELQMQQKTDKMAPPEDKSRLH